jgi:hypothetical protein
MRLSDGRLEELRRWGRGLRDTRGEEQAAAGRAILMLIEEVERLRLELLREQSTREDLASTLRDRLARSGGSDGEAASPEAWLDSLRRQD